MRRFASLRRTADFTRLRQRGRRVATANLTIFRGDAHHADKRPLVGFTISKSVGKAVVRNTVRRRLQACLHDLLAGQTPMRLLVIARPSAAGMPYGALCAELARVLS